MAASVLMEQGRHEDQDPRPSHSLREQWHPLDKSRGRDRSGKRLKSVWDKAIERHLGPWGSILNNNLGQFQYSGDRVEVGQTERAGEIRSQLKWGRRQLPRPHPPQASFPSTQPRLVEGNPGQSNTQEATSTRERQVRLPPKIRLGASECSVFVTCL